MAGIKYSRNTTESFSVNGLLSEDGTKVTYEDKKNGDVEICLMDYIKMFAAQNVAISIKTVQEEDMELPSKE